MTDIIHLMLAGVGIVVGCYLLGAFVKWVGGIE